MKISLAVKALLLATILTQTWCFSFNFPKFINNDKSRFLVTEDSSISSDTIQLTPDYQGAQITNKSGRAIYREPFRLRNKAKIASFNTTFVFQISPKTSPAGGEGLAFILTADSSLPAGSNGQWLGIVNGSTNGTTQAKIVAVEFDTRKNFPQDVDSNHVGLNVNSIVSIEQKPLMEFGVDLSSATEVYATVQYDGENISIYVSMSNKTEDHLKNRIIFRPLNLSVLPDEVYVGFSASTSNYTQLNSLKSWEFNGTDFGEEKNYLWVWITVAMGVAGSCGAGILVYWMRIRKSHDMENPYPDMENQIDGGFIAPRVKKFRLTELEKATNNFDPKNSLGRGGFGTVYKGILMNREVAVKRVSKDSRQGKREFIAEVTTIGSFHHKNLVKLIGWCYEKRDLLLVYEFMPNGSLDKLLFGDNKSGSTSTMDNQSVPNWQTRRNIIQGVAAALDYLHNGCEERVLHRDVKSSNIMLDSRFDAKLGDFGLARAIRRTDQTHHSTREIAGTPSYMAPETFLTSRAMAETDVYAFGVLILEVICRRKPGNPYELGGYDGSIAHWAWEFHKNGRIVEAVDGRMEGGFDREEMEDMLILGLACCHPNPNQRPAMRRVVQVLNGEANLPDLPRERPAFVWPPMPPSFKLEGEISVRDSRPFTELTGR